MSAQLMNVFGNSKKMSISWAIQPSLPMVPDLLSLPTFPFIANPFILSASGVQQWSQYVLDPQQVQSAANFGIAKTLGLAINRQSAFSAEPRPSPINYNPGRIMVTITGSGQRYVYCPLIPLWNPTTAISPITFFEGVNDTINLCAESSSTVEMWFEPDYSDGTNFTTMSCVYATLYNYELTHCKNA